MLNRPGGPYLQLCGTAIIADYKNMAQKGHKSHLS